MSQIQIVPQKIVDRKSVILESRLDLNSARLRGETLEKTFCVKLGSQKPKAKDVSLVASNKYYEPYLVLGGKYSIDYCKKHVYAFKVNDRTQEIYFGNKAFKSETLRSEKLTKIIKLLGEEHAHYENETYIILDRMMKEVPPEKFPLAPFDSEFKDTAEFDLDLRKMKIDLEDEIALLGSRIVKRPPDFAEVINESFEIAHRLLIYRPIYEMAYQNSKSGEAITALIDGITGEVISEEFSNGVSGKSARYINKTRLSTSHAEKHLYAGEMKASQLAPIPETPIKIVQDKTHSLLLEKRTPYLKVQFTLGCISLIVGLLAANFALFGWSVPTDSFYLLGEYARYACAYGGFGAIIFGSMLINDFLVLRSHRLKAQSTGMSPEKAESEKEQVHFIVSKFEEDREVDSQVLPKQTS